MICIANSLACVKEQVRTFTLGWHLPMTGGRWLVESQWFFALVIGFEHGSIWVHIWLSATHDDGQQNGIVYLMKRMNWTSDCYELNFWLLWKYLPEGDVVAGSKTLVWQGKKQGHGQTEQRCKQKCEKTLLSWCWEISLLEARHTHTGIVHSQAYTCMHALTHWHSTHKYACTHACWHSTHTYACTHPHWHSTCEQAHTHTHWHSTSIHTCTLAQYANRGTDMHMWWRNCRLGHWSKSTVISVVRTHIVMSDTVLSVTFCCLMIVNNAS